MGSGTHFAVIEDGEMGTVENEDYGAVLARFAPNSRGAGAVGTLEVSRVVVGPQCGLALEVYGTEGSATWNFERMNELKLALGRGGAHAGYTTVLGNPRLGDYGKFQPGPGNSMGYDDLKVIEAKKFLQSVTGRAGRGLHDRRRPVGVRSRLRRRRVGVERRVGEGARRPRRHPRRRAVAP